MNSTENGVVEQAFNKLYFCMRVMMIHAGLHENIKTSLWPECTATIFELENIMVNHTEKYAHTRIFMEII